VTSRIQFAWPALLFLATATSVSAQTQSAAPIISQMLRAQAENRIHFSPYIVTRDYKLFDRNSNVEFKSRVIAEITVVPPNSKKYTIEETAGSGWGEKIVRKLLDGEVAFAKDSAAGSITNDNYDFQLIREDEIDGRPCYVLKLLPKRNSKDLLRGTIWVDANTHLPQRIEGEPSKSPSWWLKDVRIVFRYGYAGHMWLQTSSEAIANVRLLGRSTMAWQDVRYQIGELTTDASVAETTISLGGLTAGEKR
jgi:Outer membrane lipoprotein-sorting protein